MTKEEHSNIINSIRTCESDVERNNLLLQLSNDYATVLSENSENADRIAALEKENTEYAKLNNQLFLQLGTNEPDEPEPDKTEPEPQKLSYDDLKFDN